MVKRSKSKQRRSVGAAAAQHADADNDNKEVSISAAAAAIDGPTAYKDDDKINTNEEETTTATTSKLEQLWNKTQSTLSDNLLPLVSSSSSSSSLSSTLPDELLQMLLENNTNNGSTDEDDSTNKNQQQQRTRQRLLQTSSQLFRYIEQLASMQDQLKDVHKQSKLNELMDEEKKDGNEEESESDDDGGVEPCTLSGIPTLYIGQQDNEEDDDAVDGVATSMMMDAETIWGQVEMQNSSLLPLLKKSIKKLHKRVSNEDGKYSEDNEQVRILDTGAMGNEEDSDQDEDEGGSEDGEEMSMGSAASDFDNEQDADDSEEDSQARRVRERMERAMADMSDDDDSNTDGFNNEASDNDEAAVDILGIDKRRHLQELASEAATFEDEDEGIDQDREEMRDGFFDLHEMEAFADEEEEMLPDEAYGNEMPDDANNEGNKKKKKKGVLPHLRDRMGDDSGDSDEDEGGVDDEDEDFDEDNEDDPLSKRYEPTTVRRKKYRADDEVEALYKLYDDEQGNNGFNDSDDDDEGGAPDASAMTAADLFGKPDEKLIKSYKAKKDKGTKSGKVDKGNKKDGVKKKKAALADDFNDDDADSWDNHNFEDDGMDWKDDDGEDENGSDKDDNESDEEAEGEEDIEDSEEEEDMANNTKLSAHAIQSKKLEEQTKRLEQDLISEKPWKMLGEAKGTDRAQDSLLDSTPEFEVAFKPPPILTAEHTADIETMIKKRILDEDWDDVVPRELPDIGAKRGGAGDAPEVSQEKSKLGLGELYEREYLKKTTGFDRDAHEKQTEEDAAKEEMKRLFANLCSQLDALSNYHFAPRPVADEADVQNKSEDTPAIAMEEVLPLHVSTSRARAPEELYGAGKGRQSVLKGESELDQAERKRIRNAKKSARRKARKQKHADEKLISKLQPGLGLNNPYEKRKLREELQMARASGKVVVASDNKAEWEDQAAAGKEYQTSTKFFQKMQENVEGMVHGGNDGDGRAKKKRKGLDAGHSSSAYRL